MAWTLIRYRLLAAVNSARFSTPRQRLVLLILTLVSAALALAVYVGFRLVLSIRGSTAATAAITHEMVYAVFLFMLAGSVPFLAATLLHPGDVALLGAAPIHARDVVLVRILEGTAAGAAQFAPIGAPAIAACAAGLGYQWHQWPIVAAVAAVLVVLPSAITATLLFLAVAALGHQRVRSAVALVNVLLGSLVCLTAVSQVTGLHVQEGLAGLVAGSPNPSGRLPYLPPWGWVADLMVGASLRDWAVVATASGRIGAAIAVLAPLAVAVGARLMQDGRMSGADESGPSRRSRVTRKRASAERTVMGGPVACLIRKEVRYVLRDSLLLSQVGMPVILYLVPFVMAMNPTFRANTRGDELFAFGILMVLAVLYMQASILSLSSVGLEGRAFWIVLGSPVMLGRALVAKWLVSWLMSSAMGIAMVSLSGAAFMVEWVTVAVLSVVVLISAAGLCGIGVGLAAMFPRFVFENPAHRVSPLAIVLGFGAGLAYAALLWAVLGATWYAGMHCLGYATAIRVSGLSLIAVAAAGAVAIPLAAGVNRLANLDWEF